MLSKTAKNAIDAYGGTQLWNQQKYISAEVSVNGLAFTLKRRPFFKNAKIIMEIGRPFSKISPIGNNSNITGVLDGNDVRLEDAYGQILSERKNARSFFTFGRRLLYWDDMDMSYFANYAFWNYFTLPNLLLSSEINWIEKEEGFLVGVFPASFPTHNSVQEFHFDTNSGLLVQHNYTVDIISSLETAANVVNEHNKTGDYVYPSSRLVTPRTSKGTAMKHPILIDITVHKYMFIKEL